MKWDRVIIYDRRHYFSGIYKISTYNWCNRMLVPLYYVAYKLCPSGMWGDHVNPGIQNKEPCLNLKQSKALCEEHAKTYTPNRAELKQAEAAKERTCAL